MISLAVLITAGFSQFFISCSLSRINIIRQMAKKTEKLTKEYLEDKIKGLREQQRKIEGLMEQYSQLYDKLSGAIEVTQDMLNELTEESNEKVVTVGSVDK